MDKDRIEGAYDQVKGDVKQEIGKATNDADLEVEGTWDKVKGSVKEGAGKVKDALRED